MVLIPPDCFLPKVAMIGDRICAILAGERSPDVSDTDIERVRSVHDRTVRLLSGDEAVCIGSLTADALSLVAHEERVDNPEFWQLMVHLVGYTLTTTSDESISRCLCLAERMLLSDVCIDLRPIIGTLMNVLMSPMTAETWKTTIFAVLAQAMKDDRLEIDFGSYAPPIDVMTLSIDVCDENENFVGDFFDGFVRQCKTLISLEDGEYILRYAFRRDSMGNELRLRIIESLFENIPGLSVRCLFVKDFVFQFLLEPSGNDVWMCYRILYLIAVVTKTELFSDESFFQFMAKGLASISERGLIHAMRLVYLLHPTHDDIMLRSGLVQAVLAVAKEAPFVVLREICEYLLLVFSEVDGELISGLVSFDVVESLVKILELDDPKMAEMTVEILVNIASANPDHVIPLFDSCGLLPCLESLAASESEAVAHAANWAIITIFSEMA